MTDTEQFAHALKAARTSAGLTQQDVADRIGVRVRAVQNWESASKAPRLAQLFAICELFGWPRPFPTTESPAGTGYFSLEPADVPFWQAMDEAARSNERNRAAA